MTDLSLGGAFVELEDLPAFGAVVRLTVSLPGGDTTVEGTVRWAKGLGVGLQFGRLGVRETHTITGHLADLEPMPDSRTF